MASNSPDGPIGGEGQEPDPLDHAEATLATIGMTKVLDGEMPYVGVMLQRHILNLPKRIAALCDDLVNDRLPRRLKMPRPFGYEKMLSTFSQPLPPSLLEQVHAKFATNVQDQAIQFMALLGRSYKHVADMLPVMQYDTLLGPHQIEPTGDKLWMFWNRYWVVNDPLIVLTLAQSGALLPEQVAALMEFYPSLYEHIKTGILSALVKRRLADKSFINLAPRAERGVSVLLQQRMIPFQSNQRKVQPDPLQAQPGPGPVVSAPINQALVSTGQKAATV